MKTDLYTKIILTIIAVCLLFNVFSKLDIIPAVYAQSSNTNTPELNNSQLKTNLDGSINVRLSAAEIIEVRPASGSTFKVEPSSSSTRFSIEPYSSSTKFQIEPYSSSTKFTVEPASSATFEVKPYYNSTFKVEPYSSSTKFSIEPVSSSTKFSVEPTYSSEFKVKPASNYTIFNVKQEGSSIATENIDEAALRIYPVPAKNELNIEYDLSSGVAQYLTICDVNGRMMSRIILTPDRNKTTLDVSKYPAGTYIYSCNAESGKFIVK